MHLHEYQAKMVLQSYGIAVPPFVVISKIEEVPAAIDQLGLSQAVVKIQVHAGGRGKAGGVKIAKTPDEIKKHCSQMLGMKIVNNQTGKEGIVAKQLIISPLVDIEKEYYIAATIDRERAQAVLIVSPEGGMEIEEIAEKNPKQIKVFPLAPNGVLRNYQLIAISNFMGWKGPVADQGKSIVSALAQAFTNSDAELLEINPLVLTKHGDIVALDAKMSIDENALYRHPEFTSFYDPSQLSPYEVRAKEYDLAYVALDGTIGCMVNGAGLAMATMDIIQHFGGSPANFLDVGGSATQEKIAEGFNIILSDKKVKAILVNIFGGIMNCATLAEGIIAATAISPVHVPLIVRMEGTNVENGRKILQESGLDIILANDLNEAAQKAVSAARV